MQFLTFSAQVACWIDRKPLETEKVAWKRKDAPEPEDEPAVEWDLVPRKIPNSAKKSKKLHDSPRQRDEDSVSQCTRIPHCNRRSTLPADDQTSL